MITVPEEASLATDEKKMTPTIVMYFAVHNDGKWRNSSNLSSMEGSLTPLTSVAISALLLEADNSLPYTHKKQLIPNAQMETQRFWIARKVLAARSVCVDVTDYEIA